MTALQGSPRVRRLVMLLMAAVVLVPSLFGFGTKFLEFIALYRGDVDGAFAISPILNYLLASLGFLFLFGWAILGGMFRDVEQPKYTMLDNESLLDRGEAVHHGVGLGRPGMHRDSLRRETLLRAYRFKDRHEHD